MSTELSSKRKQDINNIYKPICITIIINMVKDKIANWKKIRYAFSSIAYEDEASEVLIQKINKGYIDNIRDEFGNANALKLNRKLGKWIVTSPFKSTDIGYASTLLIAKKKAEQYIRTN